MSTISEINKAIASLEAEYYLLTKEDIEKKAEVRAEISRLKLKLSNLEDVEEDHAYNSHG